MMIATITLKAKNRPTYFELMFWESSGIYEIVQFEYETRSFQEQVDAKVLLSTEDEFEAEQYWTKLGGIC